MIKLMINKFSQSLFFFMLVWTSYRAPDLFMEGYHDIGKSGGITSNNDYYVIDVISHVYILPELCALSISVYVWIYHTNKLNIIDTIKNIFSSIILFAILYSCHKIYGLWMNLDNYREYNFLNYIGSVIAITLTIVPWIYRIKIERTSQTNAR